MRDHSVSQGQQSQHDFGFSESHLNKRWGPSVLSKNIDRDLNISISSKSKKVVEIDFTNFKCEYLNPKLNDNQLYQNQSMARSHMNLQRVKPIPPKDESLVYESPFFNNK